MPMSLNSMAPSELIIIGFAYLLQFCGWFTAFIAQTYAEHEDVFKLLNQPPLLDFGNLLRVVWMAIWAELLLVFLMPVVMFSKLRLHMLVIVLSTAGLVLASIATSATIYLVDLPYKSVTAIGSGYLVLAMANGITAVYYSIAYDNQTERVPRAVAADETVVNKA
ncbi:Uncharacterized protein MSYG_4107 [Malassezia sympodialis ATCC 42132]|uniref:Uncharacterized protein n=1 Tax=Malassezia sympodialis (strain ATCC 42132) TaxID=1230383 RepID=A0A1M8ABP8_MALS4|nr:Uncharacterized protein MSYG_4107 [Malassezia sympodialis ATCC 42132]